MTRALGLVLCTSFAVGLVALVAAVAYVASNDSGHTGVNPYLGLGVFVPVCVVGLSAVVVATGHTRWLGVASALVGVVGVGLLVYLDWSNTLLPYDEWIRRGMP